jgi:hypothetical protein
MFGEFEQEQESLILKQVERRLEARIGVKGMKELPFYFCVISSKLLK